MRRSSPCGVTMRWRWSVQNWELFLSLQTISMLTYRHVERGITKTRMQTSRQSRQGLQCERPGPPRKASPRSVAFRLNGGAPKHSVQWFVRSLMTLQRPARQHAILQLCKETCRISKHNQDHAPQTTNGPKKKRGRTENRNTCLPLGVNWSTALCGLRHIASWTFGVLYSMYLSKCSARYECAAHLIK